MGASIDPDGMKRLSFNVWGCKQSQMVSLMACYSPIFRSSHLAMTGPAAPPATLQAIRA